MGGIEFQASDMTDDFGFIETAEHPDIERLASYWQMKRGARTLPDRKDVQPSELVSLLPHIIICDVLDDGEDYRVRIFGTALVNLVGEERTGKLISEFGTDCNPPTEAIAVRRRWMESMQAAYISGRPAIVKGRMSSSRRSYIAWHGISCPLTDSGVEIRQIIGLMVTER